MHYRRAAQISSDCCAHGTHAKVADFHLQKCGLHDEFSRNVSCNLEEPWLMSLKCASPYCKTNYQLKTCKCGPVKTCQFYSEANV